MTSPLDYLPQLSGDDPKAAELSEIAAHLIQVVGGDRLDYADRMVVLNMAIVAYSAAFHVDNPQFSMLKLGLALDRTTRAHLQAVSAAVRLAKSQPNDGAANDD